MYRALVNRMLDDTGVVLRLAVDGEDQGRLVHIVDDARNDLIERALATSTVDVQDRVEDAIALFRGRDATEHHKRSAAITLAGILEERRTLIRTDLRRKDEGALFGLANESAIRHQRRGQQGNYDPAFLDWIFWWYLATMELTDQILARQASNIATSTPRASASYWHRVVRPATHSIWRRAAAARGRGRLRHRGPDTKHPRHSVDGPGVRAGRRTA